MRAQVRVNARSDPTISIVALLADDDQRAGAFLGSCLAARADALDLVVVNDGSADGTWRCIAAAKSVDPNFGAVDLAEGYGPATAMREGVRRSEGDVVLFVGVGSPRAVESLPELRREFADPDLIAIVESIGSGDASKPVTIKDAGILQQRLLEAAEGGWGDPVVARRAAIIASIDALVPVTAGRVVGQWFAPGVPVMEPGEATASFPPRRKGPPRPRRVSRRSALLAASILVSGVVVVSSHVPAPAQRTRFETVSGSLVDRVPAGSGSSWSVEDPGHRRSPAVSTPDTGRSSRTTRGSRSGSAHRTKVSVGEAGGARQASTHGAESSQGGGSQGTDGAGGSQGGGASGGGSSGKGGSGGNGGGGGTGGGGTGGAGGGNGGGGTGGVTGGGGTGGGTGGSTLGNGHGHGHAYGHSHSHAGGNGNGNGNGDGQANTTPPPAPPKKGHSGDHSGHGKGNA